MSSEEGNPQLYFCHQCNRTVTITPSPSSDLSCPSCHGGFLEEMDSPNSNPNAIDMGPALLFDDLASIFGGPDPSPFHDPEAFNPFLFLQNYLQTLRAGGANIQFVIDNDGAGGRGVGGEGGAFRLPANLGDYFIGPGLEQLIQQLAENDPNRYGTPPASKSAIDGLPDVRISEELLTTDSSQCAVCKDTFEVNEEAKQMPCKHIYHKGCILPWLEMHNSCPVCRYELPTDDLDYEQRRSGGSNAVSGDGRSQNTGASGDNPLSPSSVERRFRISLPWPLRGVGSQTAGTSNSGAGNNGGNNTENVNSNSASGGNSDFRSETRDEDLD